MKTPTLKQLFLLIGFCLLLAELSAQVNPIWAYHPNVPYDSWGTKVLTDHADNVYVCGRDSVGSIPNPPSSWSHTVLVKTHSNGTFLWKLPLDTIANSMLMLMDSSDNIYLDFHGITKMDTSGNIIWQNNAVIPPDANYLTPKRGQLAYIDRFKNLYTLGRAKNINNAYYTCFAKFDSLGNFLWDDVFFWGGSTSPGKLAVDTSGNVYVSGSCNQGNSFAFLLKYNSNGVRQWEYDYTGLSNSTDEYNDIAIDSDQNILVAGMRDQYDIMLFKLSPNRNILWQKFYAMNQGPKARVCVDAANNVFLFGNYYYFGNSFLWVTKYNSSGAQLWNKVMDSNGNAANSYSYYMGDVTLNHQGNPVVVGKRYTSDTTLTAGTHFSTALFDANGNVVFEGLYNTSDHGAVSVTIDQQNNILGTGDRQASGDMLIIKYGNISTGIPEIDEVDNAIIIYPNPAHDNFTINITGKLKIYDVTGKLMKEQTVNRKQETVNCKLNAGVYFLRVTDGGKIFTQKLVIE